MKRTRIRTILISVLVVLIAVVGILRVDIQPVEQSVPVPPVLSQPADTQEPVVTPAVGEQEPDEPEEPVVESPELSQPIPESEPPAAKPPSETTDTPGISAETAEPPAAPPLEETVPQQPEEHICTLEIRCDTVVDTSKLENQVVAPFVPDNGVILEATEVVYAPGESVFDVLLRVTREKNIHMEFRADDLYSGQYVEGINYLYVFDGGPLSGWMYQVNGQFPNYGCGAYQVSDGDRIVWVYTCDLGADVGDNSVW